MLVPSSAVDLAYFSTLRCLVLNDPEDIEEFLGGEVWVGTDIMPPGWFSSVTSATESSG